MAGIEARGQRAPQGRSEVKSNMALYIRRFPAGGDAARPKKILFPSPLDMQFHTGIVLAIVNDD